MTRRPVQRNPQAPAGATPTSAEGSRATAPREAGLLAGAAALVCVFVISWPLMVTGIALALQLQTSRVFWPVELLATLMAIWWVAEAPAAGRTRPWLARALALVLVATFGRKQDNPAIVLSYAALEGLFLGAFSFVMANVIVSGVSAGALIGQAILGTIGVFVGMLIVYKTGAIRVTPKFTRMLVAGMVGVLVLMLGNLVLGMFGVGGGEGMGLRSGGPLAIVFSLVCIAIAAFSFLLDFDAADQMIRAGAPEKAAWGVALGLTVTLVWLYIEILQLLSYFQRN